MLKNVARILLIRGDKIGDLTLCTPAIAALRVVQPSAQIVAMVRSQVVDILRGNPNLDSILAFDPVVHGGFRGFLRLVQLIRREKFEVVVVFQAPFRFALAAFLARIPYRIGPLSKWWSWIVFNMGIRQSRSNVEMHEADYNLQLLRDLGVSISEHRHRPRIYVDPRHKLGADQFFAERGLSRKYKTVAIHPGMAGSALNWPERAYVKLGRRLVGRYNVVITGSAEEEELVDRVVQKISWQQSFEPDQPILTRYIGKDTLGEFIAILDACDGIVAPSTGPMHLGVGLGKKVVTVFSPIRVQSAIRWGPYGVSFGTNLGVAPQDQAAVLVPDVNCAEDFKCALSACIYYPCMPRIPVDDVEIQLGVLLEGGEVSMFKSTAALIGEQVDLDEDFDEEGFEGQA